MIVYKIINKANNKAYIGMTICALSKRWREHVFAAAGGNGAPLYRAMRRHGIENFRIEALYEATSLAEMKAVERGLICAHGTLGPGGYNATLGGDSTAYEAWGGPLGEVAYQAILTDEIVAFIRDPARAHVTNREIVDIVVQRFGVSASRDCLRDARRGDTWTHLDRQYPPIKAGQGRRTSDRRRASAATNLKIARGRADYRAHAIRLRETKIAAKLTKEQVCAIFLDGRPHRAIERAYGLAHGAVRFIKQRKTWRDVTGDL